MDLHPNRYNRTSEAYDFSLFEGKPVEDKYTVHKKKQRISSRYGNSQSRK